MKSLHGGNNTDFFYRRGSIVTDVLRGIPNPYGALPSEGALRSLL